MDHGGVGRRHAAPEVTQHAGCKPHSIPLIPRESLRGLFSGMGEKRGCGCAGRTALDEAGPPASPSLPLQ